MEQNTKGENDKKENNENQNKEKISNENKDIKKKEEEEEISKIRSSFALNYENNGKEIPKGDKDFINRKNTNIETVLDQKINKEIKKEGTISRVSTFLQSKEINLLENSLNISIVDPTQINKNENKKNEYLSVRDISSYDINEYEDIRKKVLNNLHYISAVLIQKQGLYNIYHVNKPVGPLLPLTTLIESAYGYKPENQNLMQEKYQRLKDYICNYRTIYGDGNCYYRAVMFRYIELLIIHKKSDFLKLLIIDIYKSFENEEVKKRLFFGKQAINPQLIVQVMIIIMELIENNEIIKAHQIFYKALLYSKHFDLSLILYFRFILYDYIKKNENKYYLENFPVLIGNLLPSIYEKDGVFDFNSFYTNYLLKQFVTAEKIIIYLTPFVLGINLDVILFDDNEDTILKHFQFVGKDLLKIKQPIYVIHKIGHYENVFNYQDNKDFNDIYSFYRNDMANRFIKLDPKLFDLYTKIKNLKINQINENQKNENNQLTLDQTKQKNQLYNNINNYKINNQNNNNNIKNANINNYINNIPKNNITDNENNTIPNNNIPKNNITNNENNTIPNNNINNKNNNMNENINDQNINKNNNITNIVTNNINNIDNNIEYRKNENINQLNNETMHNNYFDRKPKTHVIKLRGNQNIENYNIPNSERGKLNNIINDFQSHNNTQNQNNLHKNINNTYRNNYINELDYKYKGNIYNQYNQRINNNINYINLNNNELNNNYQTNKCVKCSSIFKEQNKTLRNICKKCIFQDILIQSKPYYVNYLQLMRSKINNTTLDDLNNSFINSIIININGHNFNIYQILEEYIFNTNQELNKLLQYLIKYLKNTTCLYCFNNIKNTNFMIPCGCNFCSREDLGYHFRCIITSKLTYNFKCFCAFEYKPKHILELCCFLNSNKIYDNNLHFINHLESIFRTICCKCGTNGDNNNKLYPISVNDNFPCNFIHLICTFCIDLSNSTKMTECIICNKKHQYIPLNIQ